MLKKIRMSINTQFLMILMVLIIPLNIISLTISFIMIHDADVFHEIAIESILDKYIQNIDSTIENSNLLLYELTQGHYAEYKSFFYGADALEYTACRNLLSQRLLYRRALYSMADYIFLYQSQKDDLLIIPSGSESLKDFLFDNDYFSGADIKKKNIWDIVQVEETNYLIFVGYSGDVYSGVYIDLDAVMEELCKELSCSREQIILTNSDVGEMDNRMISAKSENANLIITVPKVQSFSFLSVWRIMLFLFALAGLFLIPGLFMLLKRSFIQPLLTINNAHKQLEEGNESYRIKNKSNTSEFDTVYQSFNNMASSLQDLRMENINKELAHTKMLLDNLQLQIRPHFLLNNMNLLYTLIQSKKEAGAKQLILYLSEYFRYLFQYQNSLELFSKEFSLILQYIEVARNMYPDEFTFSYDFDPEINMIRIPPLLMHNLWRIY